MRDVKKIVTDASMAMQFSNTSFGGASHRELIKWCLMKKVSGFSDGGTITKICRDLKLLTKAYNITKKGRRYLWAAFSEHYEAADV